ncbi:hypothetical protein ACIBD9_24850 [Micromonospora sp. NPDC050784]|uniref:hypothetical protein n=1 Tax=Micromonospora sp. NPDC050784 TaxID=3364281 RepID=UPI0037AF1974
MKNTSVLISGTSIAGPALAYWLHRYGFRVTIVEKTPELRTAGITNIAAANRHVGVRVSRPLIAAGELVLHRRDVHHELPAAGRGGHLRA